MPLRMLLIYLMGFLYLNTAVCLASDSSQALGSNQRRFNSAQSMIQYADMIFSVAKKGDYNLVLDIAYPEPITAYQPLVFSDVEYYQFNRSQAINLACEGLIKKNIMNVPLCLKYYGLVLVENNKYIEKFGNFISQVQSFNERMVFDRVFIFGDLGGAYFEMAKLKINPYGQLEEDIKTYLKYSLYSYEQALEYGSKALSLSFVSGIPSLHKLLEEKLFAIQFSLISAYGTLAQAVPENEVAPLANRVKELCNDFKAKKQYNLYEVTLKTLQVLEETHSLKRLESAPKGSKVFEEKRAVMATKTKGKISKLIEDQHSEFQDKNPKNDSHIKHTISYKLNSLNSIMISQEADWAPKIVAGLAEVEGIIKDHLPGENTSSSSSSSSAHQVSIENIYRNLSTLLGAENLIDQFWKYMSAFIIVGDLDGGIKRADILKNIEKLQRNNVSYVTRFVAAALKNLRGEHEEWLELEAELKAKLDLKKQKKKITKERAHKEKLEAIQLSLAETKAQQKERTEREQPISSKSESLASSILSKVDHAYDSAELDPFLFNENEITISNKQSKLEKLQRHEEAEKRRNGAVSKEESDQEQIISSANTVTRQLSKTELRELILQSSDKPLAELFGLSSGALKVDQEIEQNTWKFTREQFKTYVEVMGCEYKNGHGIHAKASLPKAVHVMRGENTITILNDFGGAITLPSWDKDYVPVYLRKQIFEARKSLRALKILEIQAMN